MFSFAHLVGRVSSEVAQLRLGVGHKGQTVRVRDVPVESVEFDSCHGLDGPLDGVCAEEVARRVEEESSVGVLGRVLDGDLAREHHLLGQVRPHQQLQQRLHTVAGTEICGSAHFGNHRARIVWGNIMVQLSPSGFHTQ